MNGMGLGGLEGTGYILSMRLRRRDHDVYCEGFMIKIKNKK